jgi:hypothetical protein
MKQMVTIEDGMTCYWWKRSRADIRKGWSDEHGQGNDHAREMAGNRYNVIIDVASEEDAILLTAMFLREFAIDSCAYWNGRQLSLYCGDAGSGWANLKRRVHDMAMNYIAGEKFPDGLLDEVQ